jgi:hypothetical protein
MKVRLDVMGGEAVYVSRNSVTPPSVSLIWKWKRAWRFRFLGNSRAQRIRSIMEFTTNSAVGVQDER